MNKVLVNRIMRIFMISAAYAAIIYIFTFPLYTNISGFFPGFHSSDESYAAIWYSWRIQYAVVNHLSLMQTDYIAYPFGVNLFFSGIFAVLWLAWTHFLAIFTHPVVSYNIQVLLNTLFCALFTYGLVNYLTGQRAIGFFGGLAFAFSPYQSVRIWQHLSLSYNQWIPLILFAAVLLKDSFTKKRTVLFLSSLLLLFSFEYTILYIGIIVLFVFFIYVFFYKWKAKFITNREILKQDLLYLKRATGIMVIAFLLLSFQFYPIIRNMFSPNNQPASAFNTYKRPFEDLFSQSARPLSYFFPATAHPLFGKFTEYFVGTSVYGESFTEHTLYLGWVPLVLAFIAFRRWRRNKKVQGQPPKSGVSPFVREDFYIGFFVFLAIAAWFFSQPPWWSLGHFKIYMPSFFMYKILPMFRAYCRFGIVVMLAVAVLAGFGLKFLLERFKGKGSRALVTALFCGLVLFEFWNYPPFKVIDVSRVPAVYYWLELEPQDTVIAEYPLDADSPNEMYKFFQTAHEKKMINGTIPFTYANKVAKIITKLSSTKTSGILSWMGVKYVLVHHQGYLETGLIEDMEELERIAGNENLIFIRRFPQQDCPDEDIPCVAKSGIIDVYEVSAEPIEPEVAKDD